MLPEEKETRMFIRGKRPACAPGQLVPRRRQARAASLALAGAAALALPALASPPALASAPACSNNSITSNFNGTAIAGGDTIWFNSVVKAKGASSGGVIEFRNQKVTWSANGKSFDFPIPDSVITYSTTATKASGTFNHGTDQWEITVPASFGDNVFLSGDHFTVPSGGLPGGINPVTWTGTFTTSPGVSLQWQWGAAAYTKFGLLNEDGIKFTHSTTLDEYHNGDQAGTPENFKQFVTGGARGGGGANATGSYSPTGSCEGGASGPKIYLGYFAVKHPNPWKGEPRVVFEGEGKNDAGAIRIDAATGGSTTVSGVSVKIGSCTYSPWPGLNVTLSSGERLILSETSPTTACGTSEGANNFDTSESFLFAEHPNACVKDSLIPEIKLTLDGKAETLLDGGQILNTGGADLDNCGSPEEIEFHEWTQIA